MAKSLNSNNKHFRTFRSFDRVSEAEAERDKKKLGILVVIVSGAALVNK